jgi:hypothetical protein
MIMKGAAPIIVPPLTAVSNLMTPAASASFAAPHEAVMMNAKTTAKSGRIPILGRELVIVAS